MRAAIYFTPCHDDPLTRRAIAWLGRDAFTGEMYPLSVPSTWVSGPARYGFHATMKAPFRLGAPHTLDGLAAALDDFVDGDEIFGIGHLEITRIGDFFALAPVAQVSAMAALEEAVRTDFDRFRAALTEVEIARRQPEHLSVIQRENLMRWGYPHVGAQFRFHMTLTAHLAKAEFSSAEAALREHFTDVLVNAINIDALTLFVEPEPGASFHVHSRHLLRTPIPVRM